VPVSLAVTVTSLIVSSVFGSGPVMKLRSSGSGPAIGVSKKRAGSGWMTVTPSEAKNVAICS
jgi:formyltetrahydrofolate synthetase